MLNEINGLWRVLFVDNMNGPKSNISQHKSWTTFMLFSDWAMLSACYCSVNLMLYQYRKFLISRLAKSLKSLDKIKSLLLGLSHPPFRGVGGGSIPADALDQFWGGDAR